MATFVAPNIGQYQNMIDQLGKRAVGIIKYSCYPAAGMVCDAIKAATPTGKTSGLRDSIGLTKYRTERGYTYTKIEFSGYDSNGVPNAVKAHVLTSGRSDQPGRKKNPWIRKTTNAVKAQAVAMMEESLDKKLNEIFK